MFPTCENHGPDVVHRYEPHRASASCPILHEVLTYLPLEKLRLRARELALSAPPPAVAIHSWNTLVIRVIPYWGQMLLPPTLET